MRIKEFLEDVKRGCDKHFDKALQNLKNDDNDDIFEASNNLYWIDGAMTVLCSVGMYVDETFAYDEILKMIQEIGGKQAACDYKFGKAFHTRR